MSSVVQRAGLRIEEATARTRIFIRGWDKDPGFLTGRIQIRYFPRWSYPGHIHPDPQLACQVIQFGKKNIFSKPTDINTRVSPDTDLAGYPEFFFAGYPVWPDIRLNSNIEFFF